MTDMEPEIRERLTRLEKAQEFHGEDLRALKAENKLTIQILADLKTSLEILSSKIANVDTKHSNESDEIRHTVERWIDLAFKLIVIGASAYFTVTLGGSV